MIKPYKEKLDEIRTRVRVLLQDILEANKITYQMLQEKDTSFALHGEELLADKREQLIEIDNAILKVMALYGPEAVDLRAMIAYLKITNVINRASINSKNYLKNIQGFINQNDHNIAKILGEAEILERSTIAALELLLELFDATERAKIEKLNHNIMVESAKSDDIYAIIEKDVLKMIQCDDVTIEDYFNLLKTIRKSQKIIDRAESIASLLVFSKLGGEMS